MSAKVISKSLNLHGDMAQFPIGTRVWSETTRKPLAGIVVESSEDFVLVAFPGVGRISLITESSNLSLREGSDTVKDALRKIADR